MNILIAGASGFIGQTLFSYLTSKGHNVKVLVRRTPYRVFEVQWNPDSFEISQDALLDIDVVINLCGRNISDWLWTPKFKQELYESRIKPTRTLALAISKISNRKLTFISTSGVGIYGAQLSTPVTEESPLSSGFFPELAINWEKEAMSAAFSNHRVAVVRLGVVLGRSGGLLKKLLPIFKLGLGAKMGSGKNWISWVAIDDVCRAFEKICVTQDLSGPINLVNPNSYLADDFYKELGIAVSRPVIFRIPEFLIRLVFGEFAEETILSSQRVEPKKLLDSGFEFGINSVREAVSIT